VNKKLAILLVIAGEALVYLFLFVGLPAFEAAVICPTCNARELFPTPLILYFMPGLIGVLLIILVWKQKQKEVKKDG